MQLTAINTIDAAAVRRPIIGVTGPDRGGLAAWLAVRFGVWLAGGRARRITPASPAPIGELAGLVLTGGDDIEPRRYYRASDADTRYDPARDALELDLVERAVERDLPLLAICRGMQLVNIAHGGSLIDDIELQARAHRSPLPRWYAECAPGAHLTRVLDRSRVRINKIHHQAVERLGDGILEVAWDEDGLIQGIEVKAMTFGLGVQWRPEYLPYLAAHRRLFDALVEAARAPSLPLRVPVDAPAVEVALEPA